MHFIPIHQLFCSGLCLPSLLHNSNIKEVISTTKGKNTQSHVFGSKKIVPVLNHSINLSYTPLEVQILSLRPVILRLYDT